MQNESLAFCKELCYVLSCQVSSIAIFIGGIMKNTTLYKFLVFITLLSWLVFIVFMFLVYMNYDFIWILFISLIIACVSTVMLSRFRSDNY